MSMQWGVYPQSEHGIFVAYHVIPCVVIEGEDIRSGDHVLSGSCECAPILEHSEGGSDIWAHHDPEHPGALTAEEWDKKIAEAK